jgi:hypothetical protein
LKCLKEEIKENLEVKDCNYSTEEDKEECIKLIYSKNDFRGAKQFLVQL